MTALHYPGAQYPKKKSRAGLIILLCVVAAVLLTCGIGSLVAIGNAANDKPEPPASPVAPVAPPVASGSGAEASTEPTKAAVPAGPATSFGDGTWIVGEDIAPGTYTTTVPDLEDFEWCRWDRLKGFGGSFNDTLELDTAQEGERVVVTIKKTDAGFKSSDCGTWKKAKK